MASPVCSRCGKLADFHIAAAREVSFLDKGVPIIRLPLRGHCDLESHMIFSAAADLGAGKQIASELLS